MHTGMQKSLVGRLAGLQRRVGRRVQGRCVPRNNANSRVKSVTDALSQVKTYSYTRDNRLAAIAYIGAPRQTRGIKSFAF